MSEEITPYDFMNHVNPGYSNTRVVNTIKDNSERPSLRCLFDWLGFTFKSDDIRITDVVQWFDNHLCIRPDDWSPGRRFYQGYADSFVFENITIYYNGADNQGIHVDISGQGCRYIDLHYQKLRIQADKNISDNKFIFFNWKELFTYLSLSEDINITRIDIAADDFSNYIDVSYLFYKSLNGELTMKFRQWRPDGRFNSDGKTDGITLYYGSNHSDLQLTIYEKNKQLGLPYHWTRLELQFRRKRAENVVRKILDSDDPVGIIFAGVLKNYLTFRDRNNKDDNKSRWPVSAFWDKLLKDIEPVKVSSAMPDRSIIKSHDWMYKQVSRTMARLFFAFQDYDENWIRDIIEDGFTKLNNDDKRMIEEFRRIYKDKKRNRKKSVPLENRIY